jgi:hypothetical protein
MSDSSVRGAGIIAALDDMAGQAIALAAVEGELLALRAADWA